MKILPATPRNRAVSLPELVAILAVVVLLFVIFILPSGILKNKAPRIYCVNNLKQVASAFRVWGADHGGQYPMGVYTNAMGGQAFADSSNSFRYFQVMSNELSEPKIAWCPEDGKRRAAVNFTSDFSNHRLSYFVGLQAAESNPNMFLAGDRNITNGLPVKNGLLLLDTNRVAGWTRQIHHGAGNIAFTDGSVQQLTSSGLNTAMLHSGITNWLVFP